MIQDIAPHKLDNQFKFIDAKMDDYIILVKKGKAVLKVVEDDEDVKPSDQIEAGLGDGFTAVNLRLTKGTDWEGFYENILEKAYYLLAIDGEPYFLLELTEEDEAVALPEGKFEEVAPMHFQTMAPKHHALAGITATQIYRWRNGRKFCGRCGTKTENSKTERALVCPKCGQIEYPKISPAIIVAVNNNGKLLMTRYAGRPFKFYALVAGFVEIGETFEECVAREVKEEVGINIKNIRYYKSQPWAFSDTEMIGFTADLDGDPAITVDKSELAEAGWFDKEEIPERPSQASIAAELMMNFKYDRF